MDASGLVEALSVACPSRAGCPPTDSPGTGRSSPTGIWYAEMLVSDMRPLSGLHKRTAFRGKQDCCQWRRDSGVGAHPDNAGAKLLEPGKQGGAGKPRDSTAWKVAPRCSARFQRAGSAASSRRFRGCIQPAASGLGGLSCCRLTRGVRRATIRASFWGRTGFDRVDAPEAACRGRCVGLVNHRIKQNC